MRRKAITVALTLLVIGVFAGIAANVRADSWALPQKKKYYSPNKNYYLEVTPKQLQSQLSYFEDKVEGKKNAGARKDIKDNQTKGAFYARLSDGRFSKRADFPLVNEVSPVSAVVSGKGDFFVTFDNWHSVGYGDDVVVIYRSDGTLVKKFALGDLLTEGDIRMLSRSVSSIWWGGEHYIDEAKGILVLKVVSNRKNTWEDSAKFIELKIELAAARPLEPKRDRLAQYRVFSSAYDETAPAPADASPGKPVCAPTEESFDSPEIVRVPAEQFYAKAKARPLPPFPKLAWLTGAESTVIVEILVSKTGKVICARSLSGHTLVTATAVAAVFEWTFEPVEASGKSTKAIGRVAINFKLTEEGN